VKHFLERGVDLRKDYDGFDGFSYCEKIDVDKLQRLYENELNFKSSVARAEDELNDG
jgi:hypothetical protein